MSTWNYRILERDDHLTIIEAYYDDGDDKTITAWAEVVPGGDDREDLAVDLMHMLEAFTRPNVTQADLPKPVEGP